MKERLQWRVLPYDNLVEALFAAPSDRPFVTMWTGEDEEESLTFGEFRQQARGLASSLRQRGVASGDCVIVVMPQGIAAMIVFAGAMMLGAIPAFLPYPNAKVEPSKYRSGLQGVISNLKARFIVIDSHFPAEMLEYVTGTGGEVIRPSTAWSLSVAADEFPVPQKGTSKVAFIQHSAGTTGLQKGVALSHGSVLAQIEHLQRVLNVDAVSDCIYSWLPLYHDMGLIACFMLPMVCHVPAVMQSPLDWVMHPGSMLQAVTQHRCTLAWMPNFAFQFVARRTRLERMDTSPDLSSLRALINCSEPVRASSMQEFQDAFDAVGFRATALQTSYAMAENVFAVTQSSIGTGPVRLWVDAREFHINQKILAVRQDSPGAICFVSSGQVLPGQELRILSESGEDAGCVGEILIRGDCLFTGYYNRPDLSQEAFFNGWYRTGDIGFIVDGELYVVGRKKELIIVGGENIYPQDIEEIVATHPAIHDGRAIALGAYNSGTGTEDIILVAELEDEGRLSSGGVIEQELRNLVVAGMGVAVSTIYLKPAKWIVKSTAGKPSRAATLEKLMREHPDLVSEKVEETKKV